MFGFTTNFTAWTGYEWFKISAQDLLDLDFQQLGDCIRDMESMSVMNTNDMIASNPDKYLRGSF